MFDIQRVETEWAGRRLVLETGRIARQAHGAVLATYGETSVLATVVADTTAKPGIDFFPLTVNYQEKTFAAGKIPGGYFKREGRPTEKETLTSRLIDRPIRPLFAPGFKCETQVVGDGAVARPGERSRHRGAGRGVGGADLSGVPFMGPIGGARVGYINGGNYVLNPQIDEMSESKLDLVVAGTADAVLMVESEAKELPEDIMLGAVMFGHRGFQPVIDLIIKLAERAAKEPRDFAKSGDEVWRTQVVQLAEAGLRSAYAISAKGERHDAVSAIKAQVMDTLAPKGVADAPAPELIASLFKDVEKDIVRGNILERGIRIDGRDLRTVRPILAEVGILPRTHGSALFTRGETQALVVATLGTGDDEQYDRRAGGDLQGDVPPPLQLPALFGGRGRAARLARPARDRPRQARLARDPAGAAAARPSSPTRSAWCRRSPSPTGRRRWRRCAARRWR